MNYGRFPSEFPAQIPWTRGTLFSVRFLILLFSFLRFFSFFFCGCAVCVCPWMCCRNFSYFLVLPCPANLVNLAYTHLISFTSFKLWTNISPCFKASPLDWKGVESWSFKSFSMTFNFFHHSSMLFERLVQFAPVTGLQLVSWHGKPTRPFWTAIHTYRKVASFACIRDIKMPGSFSRKMSLSSLLRILEWASFMDAIFPGWIK